MSKISKIIQEKLNKEKLRTEYAIQDEAKEGRAPEVTRCVIYARYSPRPEKKIGGTIESQLEICKNFALQQGWQIKDFFVDEGMSGGEIDRPGLWDAVKTLDVSDVLLVYRLNRLARDTYLFCLIERQLEKKDCRIVSASGEGTESHSAESKLIRQILQALAEYERAIIRARIKASHARKQAAGYRISRHPPYGWKIDPNDPKKLLINEQEQEAKEEIIRVWRMGLSQAEIAEWISNSFDNSQVRSSVNIVYKIINEYRKLKRIGKFDPR